MWVLPVPGPDLHLDLMALATPGALALEHGLMRGVGQRQAAREHPAVPARQLAGVQHRGGDVLLGDAHLDPATGERGIDGVVVAIHPHERLGRDADDVAAVGVGHLSRQRPHLFAFLGQPLRGDRSDRAVHPPVGLLSPGVKPVLEVEMVGEHPARLEVGAHEPV